MKRVVYSDILDIDKICSVYHKIMYNTKHRKQKRKEDTYGY